MHHMDVKVLPAALRGVVRARSSKSQAHRALICAALADQPTRIVCEDESEDIGATVVCLSALGAIIARKGDSYIVHPILRNLFGSATLPCGESGSTFRFLLPVVGAMGREAEFQMKGRLQERPLSPLREELIAHGCEVSTHGSVPFRISGQLTPGLYSMSATVSSQFISGLLLALPLLQNTSYLYINESTELSPYIDLTLAMLETFGINIKYDGTLFTIPGGQTYKTPGFLHIESDWSGAAVWLCAGALSTDGVVCTGLDPQSRQGDRAITNILTKFGAKVNVNETEASVSGGNLRGTAVDAQNIPDLVPILAVIGAFAEGVTTISNAERLRFKESNRLSAATDFLHTLGADIVETEDGLCIHGGAPLSGGKIFSFKDHRIAMAASIAATMCAEPVMISGAEAVAKSYPDFYKDFAKLGGSIQIIWE